ncbi:MAG: tRNA (adenine-N1)-methyltransferase [Actinobacteria bacterium]|nr:tRNA (adenine-N1)-methyltransferase [Actinomycetota bacterium]
MKELEFKEGDLCTVRIIKKNFLVKLKSGEILHTNKGYVRHNDIIGILPGSKLLTNLNKPVYVFRPSVEDLVFSVKRFTNISYPKEIAWIVFSLGLKNGMKVLESGTGSGSLAIALAYFVSPEGRVISCERREEFIDDARKSIEKAGLLEYVELRAGDLKDAVSEVNYFDACVLDLPEPWGVLETVYDSLKPGAPLAIFVPTVNQVEKTVISLRNFGFMPPQTMEILHRFWDIKTGASRPEFEMRGHTGFIVQTRKIISREDF